MISIFGYSDDLVEVEGDIYEEFPSTYKHDDYIATSNGLLMKVSYDGVWRMHVIRNPNDTPFEHHPAGSEKATQYNDYTELVEIHEDCEWLLFGNGFKFRSQKDE